MEGKVSYSLREPRVKPDGITDESRRKMSEASKFSRTDETKDLMSDKRRERFVNQNPLEEGEVYISYRNSSGNRRHATAILIDGIEISLNGVNWFKVKETGKPIKEELKRLK